ncbi:MAG: EAL domain-containing protein [Calothrix sp. SM1_5_4]|nr:EAL domain-containing protein [Calothrix sp. SM1_5_4]
MLHRSTMMALGEGRCRSRSTGRIVSANAAAERILGIKLSGPSESIATDARWHTIHEDGSDFLPAEYPALITLATGEPQRNVIMGVKGLDGQITWISINTEPLFENAGGKPTAAVISFTDITARKQVQEVLVEAISVIPDGFAVFDEKDRLLICNQSYRSIYEITGEHIRIGERFEDLIQKGLDRGQYPQAGETDAQKEAWLKERLEQHHKASSCDIQRLPEDRWIQIRERRTPSGYTVGLRIDITQVKRQTAILQAVVDNFPGGVALFDDAFKLITCNQRFQDIHSLPDKISSDNMPTLEAILRSNALRGEYGLGNPEDHVQSRLDRAREFARRPHTYERIRPDRTVVEIRSNPTPNGGFIITYVDVTARHNVARRLAESERQARETAAALNVTLAHMSQGLTMFDAKGRLVVWNEQYVELYRLPRELVRRGVSLREVLTKCRQLGGMSVGVDGFIRDLRQKARQGRTFAAVWRLKDGRSISMVHTPTDDGGWVTTHEDITEREQVALKIRSLAQQDPLTGLANRTSFREHLEAALAQAERFDEQFSVLLIDLDHFKSVNDTLGHAAGDKLLQAVAARMRCEVREGDLVARLGGDEFAILQKGGRNQRESAISLASRLVDVIGNSYEIDGRQVNLGTSIGIAIAPDAASSGDQLLKAADMALYEVKNKNKNGFYIYDKKIEKELYSRKRLESDLREVISNGGLQLDYQPVVSLSDQSVCGVEALIRWKHATRGLLMPGQFIQLSEEAGLISALGEWVIRQACLDAARWPNHIKVAVNVSPNHIKQRTLVGAISRALADVNINPERLEIEVTESVLLQNDTDMISELRQIQSLGISIALDDFGTGYSSLSHLRMFEFNKIKIDRQFVAEITERADCAAIVCAITGLARSLGIVTTAEGVENNQQVQLLVAAGCSQGQGYLFGRPQPAEQIDFFVSTRQARKNGSLGS